jgi:hypothetical protein
MALANCPLQYQAYPDEMALLASSGSSSLEKDGEHRSIGRKRKIFAALI